MLVYLYYYSMFLCREPGADVSSAADDEAGQVALRHHLSHRAGAPGPGQVQRCRSGILGEHLSDDAISKLYVTTF